MARAIKEISTITAKGQTTVPKAVRQALGVDAGDRIAFQIDGGKVTVQRADEEREDDPVVGAFLQFLAKDMARHPERLKGLSPSLKARMAALGRRVQVDLEAPIEGEVDI
jgi:antitoxin PrlF